MADRVLITGANRGLGLEFTRQCAERGDVVLAACRTPATAEALLGLQREHAGCMHVLALDVADTASINSAWDAANQLVDGLDVLINVAGVNSMSDHSADPSVHLALGQLDADAMLGMFRVNAIGPLMLAQRFLPLLKAGDNARIANVSSWLGSLTAKTGGGNYSYCASKTALNMLTRALAFDVQPMGIVAVALNPGWVKTDMGGPRASLTPEQSVQGMLQVIDQVQTMDAGRFLEWNGKEHPW